MMLKRIWMHKAHLTSVFISVLCDLMLNEDIRAVTRGSRAVLYECSSSTGLRSPFCVSVRTQTRLYAHAPLSSASTRQCTPRAVPQSKRHVERTSASSKSNLVS